MPKGRARGVATGPVRLVPCGSADVRGIWFVRRAVWYLLAGTVRVRGTAVAASDRRAGCPQPSRFILAFHSCRYRYFSYGIQSLSFSVFFCRRGWLRPRNFPCSLPVVPCLCLSRAKRRIVGEAWYIRMADSNYPRLLPGCSEPTILHYMSYEGGNTLREGGRGADTAAGAWNRTKAYAKTVCRCGNRRSRLMRFLARPNPSCRVIPVRGMSGSAAFP